MPNQPTLHYLIGIPGSGKSTYAKAFTLGQNITVLSSDAIREEIFGSEEIQDTAHKVFETLFKRAKELLAQGCDVMVDATNINRKKRINALKQFRNVRWIAHYIATPIARCIINDAKRERHVGYEVVARMHEQMQVPAMFEGWDEIKIINLYPVVKKEVALFNYYNETLEQNNAPQHSIMELLADDFNCFRDILNLPQDSKYHSLSVSRHTYYVYEHLQQNYYGEDRLAMLWAALLHDTGKFRTKRFKPGARYANFIAHENVSAQIACHVLQLLGFDQEFILKVMEICQLHMDLLGIEEDENAMKRRQDTWGNPLYKKMHCFHEADTKAK